MLLRKKQIVLLVVTLVLVTLWLRGCGLWPASRVSVLRKLYSPSQDKDVTADPRYNFSSFTGTRWKTKVKVALGDGKRYTGAPETVLLAPQRFDTTHPRYIPTTNTKIVSVLPVGTVLRIDRLLQDQGAWGGLRVAATLEMGTNTLEGVFMDGLLLSNNKHLHTSRTEENWDMNPEMLEKVETR